MLMTGRKGSSGTWNLHIENNLEVCLMTQQIDKIKLQHFWRGEELNLEGEFGLALRLPPNDESQHETHSEDQAEGREVPHSSASLHGQYTERQDECP